MTALKAPAEKITIPVNLDPEDFKWLTSTWRLCLSVGFKEEQNDDDDGDNGGSNTSLPDLTVTLV